MLMAHFGQPLMTKGMPEMGLRRRWKFSLFGVLFWVTSVPCTSQTLYCTVIFTILPCAIRLALTHWTASAIRFFVWYRMLSRLPPHAILWVCYHRPYHTMPVYLAESTPAVYAAATTQGLKQVSRTSTFSFSSSDILVKGLRVEVHLYPVQLK